GADCESRVCTNNVCSAPTCVDGKQNGTETDKDCGGTCTPCANGLGCKMPGDCVSLVCTGLVCQAPACDDGVANGMETDVDCGGTCAKLCAAGQKCKAPGDCKSSICNGDRCGCPSGMVIVPIPGAGSYCIDATEVTYKDYAVFINSNPNT